MTVKIIIIIKKIFKEAGQRLTEYCQENAVIITKTVFQQHEKTLHMNTPDSQY